VEKRKNWLEKSLDRKPASIEVILARLLACLHDQNKTGFFGGPALFMQPIKTI